MNAVRTALRLIDRLSLAAAAVGAACLALIPALILADIGYGLMTRASLTFVWEYAAFLMAAAFFLGLGHTLRTGGHVRVSLVAENLPPRAAWALDVAATVIAMYFAAFVAYAMMQFAYSSYASGSVSFTPTATPLHIPQAALAFGSILLVLQMAARLVRLLIGDAPDTPPASDISFEH